MKRTSATNGHKHTTGAMVKDMPADGMLPPENLVPKGSPDVLPDEPSLIRPPAPPVPPPGAPQPIGNPVMAEAINRIQAVMQGRGVTSNGATLLGEAHVKIAQLEEALQISVDALGALVADMKKEAEKK